VAASISLCSRPARADGAFPDSLGILLPSEQPHRIVASTNFGLVVSDDDGRSFALVCEDVIGMLASIYQVGPAPDNRLFAVTVDGLKVSNDACTWNMASGPLSNVADAFPDPSDPRHVLAIAQAPSPSFGTSAQAVYESKDGGNSFGAERKYTGPESAFITGVEIAKTDSSAIYLTMYKYVPAPIQPFLVRSNDAGQSWQELPLDKMIGPMWLRLLAVDPEDAKKVYLRLYDNSASEKLGIYDDASGSVKIAHVFEHRISAFLRRADGALIVGTREDGAFVSTDGGDTFTAMKGAPHLRALGERDGRIYAVADDVVDGYAVGVSMDQGSSFQPLLRFSEITGPLSCGNVPARCQIAYQNLLLTLPMSQANEESPMLDAAVTHDASLHPHRDGGNGTSGARSGCGCSALGGSPPSHLAAAVLGIAGIQLRLLTRRRRKRPSNLPADDHRRLE
jgi:hypothetical protein